MQRRLVGGALLVTLLSGSTPVRQDALSAAATKASADRVDARFKFFPTQNLWTFLLLDSDNGRVWQVHYSLTDSLFAGRLALNETELAPPVSAHVGRFTLQETRNMFTFLLLDQDDGRVWQLQWSNDEEKRGIIRLLATAAP